MMRLRNEAAEQIQDYVEEYVEEKKAEVRLCLPIFYADKVVVLWDVIERLLDMLDEEQLEQIPAMLRGEEIL